MTPEINGQLIPPLCHSEIQNTSLEVFGSDVYTLNEVIYWLLLREEQRLKVEKSMGELGIQIGVDVASGEDKTVESFYCPHCGTTEMLCGHNGVGCDKEPQEDLNDEYEDDEEGEDNGRD